MLLSRRKSNKSFAPRLDYCLFQGFSLTVETEVVQLNQKAIALTTNLHKTHIKKPVLKERLMTLFKIIKGLLRKNSICLM